MAKYVPDVKSQRWVIISPQRLGRPSDSKVQKPTCPFCPGHESLTPPEVWRIGGEGKWNQPGWKVRVIPNKYPITDVHEVIIHSPDCNRDIVQLPLEHVQMILTVYRTRYEARKNDGQVMLFCNHGLQAGASLTHPHSQLVVIPKQINLDTLVREAVCNIVEEYSNFIAYCPDFSQWPYEVWIIPKVDGVTFGQIDDKHLNELALILQQNLQRLTRIYSRGHPDKQADLPYNYYIYHGENWYLRIIPRFIHRAGFELGTGLQVNIVDPSTAAKELITQ